VIYLFDSVGRCVESRQLPTPEEFREQMYAQCGAVCEVESDTPFDIDEIYLLEGAIHKMPAKPGRHYAFDYTTTQWLNAQTVERARAEKWEEIKNHRINATQQPITVGADTFDADSTSQARILAAIQVAEIVGPSWTAIWTLADNTSIEVDRSTLAGVVTAIGARTNSLFEQARALRAEIESAATLDAVESVAWPVTESRNP